MARDAWEINEAAGLSISSPVIPAIRVLLQSSKAAMLIAHCYLLAIRNALGNLTATDGSGNIPIYTS